MKCPECNNELIVREMGGVDYIVCKNCKKVYKPDEIFGNTGNSGKNTEPENPKMALSITSMILGIIGLLLSCIWIGIFPAAIGLILGIIALATRQSKGMAIAGLVTSVMAILIGAFVLITGTAAKSILEEQGLISSDESKKESVKKDADNSEDISEPEETTSTPQPEPPADDNMIDYNTGEYIIKYTGHAVGTDYKGDPCLLVYYDFTNNSDKTVPSATSVRMRAFQNGIECPVAVFTETNEGIQNYARDIQPGITINVAQSFSISDMSEVTLEGSKLIAFGGSKDTMVIQLQ